MQNRSSAVMQQRIEPDDSFDDFPTPPWGTRALVENVLDLRLLPRGTAWEPCCNRGYMARPLREYYAKVYASDIFDYGWSGMDERADFLFPGCEPSFPVDWIFANPPFRLAEQFIDRARNVARIGFAVLVRTAFLEGVGRYNRLFSTAAPTITAQFVERLPMVKGRIDRKASTATSYAWLVWVHGMERQPFDWIPPCRAKLERDGDYPADEGKEAPPPSTSAPLFE